MALHQESSSPAVRSKRVVLGPVSFSVSLSARRAHAVRSNLLYRRVLRPALAALEHASLRNDYWTGELPDGAEDTDAARTLWARVMTNPAWYHTIDLPHGLATPGAVDYRALLDHYHLPLRLDGMRALDIATFDGFWAFELERRGAREVVAIDLDIWTDADLPPQLRDRMIDAGFWQSFGAGFPIAKGARHSRVTRKISNVYDLTPAQLGGTFDFVFCGDLIPMLSSPPWALQRIFSVSRGEVRFVEVYDPNLDDAEGFPAARFVGAWNSMCIWWIPSLRCLVNMIEGAGFHDTEVLETVTLAGEDGSPVTRAVIRAWA